MKKLVVSLLTCTATMALAATAATAADLPVRAAPPVIAPIPIFTWTGFYAGVNVGGAWSNNNNHDDFGGSVFIPAGTFPGAFATTSGTLSGFGFGNGGNQSGFTGGGQVGYNYQVGSFVIGAETDIQGIATDNNNNDFFGFTPTFAVLTGPGLPPGTVVVPSGGLRGVDWFGTVRVRAGVAFDRWLVYATGGFAYGGGGGGNNNFCGGFVNCSNDDTRTGWTAGGGVEYAFTNNFTARVEGLWVQLDNNNNRFAGTTFDPVTRALFVGGGNRGDHEFGVVRAAVNYKFSTY
ncbi:outer membrane protein [Microvirga sp. 2TAF3]|uniref:outer membrane protein n=1 Tax=Microvirga sp. 2TAF3 TaxID=3233014 RepID=UPI003F99B6D5